MNPPHRIGTRRLHPSRRPWVMGIVNLTPDSFSDGGRLRDVDAAVAHALRLVEEGADILDLGGESSRPGARPVPLDEERQRVLPVLRALRPRVTVPISIDTTKAGLASPALDAGADMINDISALRFDPDMPRVLADSACSVVLMHMQGEPRTMQESPRYDDVVREVGAFLQERATFAEECGIDRSRLFFDPGIGFGKRLQDNLALLQQLGRLRRSAGPLVVGASRKRFLGELLGENDPLRRLEGNLAVCAWCQAQDVDVVRVHDVGATRGLLTVLQAMMRGTATAPRHDDS